MLPQPSLVRSEPNRSLCLPRRGDIPRNISPRQSLAVLGWAGKPAAVTLVALYLCTATLRRPLREKKGPCLALKLFLMLCWVLLSPMFLLFMHGVSSHGCT